MKLIVKADKIVDQGTNYIQYSSIGGIDVEDPLDLSQFLRDFSNKIPLERRKTLGEKWRIGNLSSDQTSAAELLMVLDFLGVEIDVEIMSISTPDSRLAERQKMLEDELKKVKQLRKVDTDAQPMCC